MAVSEIFGEEADSLATMILATEKEDEMMAAANDFLLRRIPALDERSVLARQLVEQVLHVRFNRYHH